MEKFRSLHHSILEVMFNKNTELRRRVQNVARLDDEDPKSEKSTHGRNASIKTKIVDEDMRIKSLEDPNQAGDQELDNAKQMMGGVTQVDMNPKTNDKIDNENAENSKGKSAAKQQNKLIGQKGAPSKTLTKEENDMIKMPNQNPFMKSDKTFGVSSSLVEAAKSIMEKKLKGNQEKLDANHNGEIDADDFKKLRARKGMKAEEACPKCGSKNCKCGHNEEVEFSEAELAHFDAVMEAAAKKKEKEVDEGIFDDIKDKAVNLFRSKPDENKPAAPAPAPSPTGAVAAPATQSSATNPDRAQGAATGSTSATNQPSVGSSKLDDRSAVQKVMPNAMGGRAASSDAPMQSGQDREANRAKGLSNLPQTSNMAAGRAAERGNDSRSYEAPVKPAPKPAAPKPAAPKPAAPGAAAPAPKEEPWYKRNAQAAVDLVSRQQGGDNSR